MYVHVYMCTNACTHDDDDDVTALAASPPNRGPFRHALPLLGTCLQGERLGHQVDDLRSSTAVAYSRLLTDSSPGAEWVPDAVLRGSWGTYSQGLTAPRDPIRKESGRAIARFHSFFFSPFFGGGFLAPGPSPEPGPVPLAPDRCASM